MIQNIHFIAIGGRSMHNLAITLKKNGYSITGSDAEIYNPSHSTLVKHNLLPERLGWFRERIHKDLDAVIVGGHISKDNPELLKAQELGLTLYSYPEFIYEFSKRKKRVVIAGSHGKNTIAAIVMHVLEFYDIEFDYLISTPVYGQQETIKLSKHAKIIIIEGDEDITSTIDNRSKFEHYKPDIALLNGIKWSYIEAFPTYKKYVSQFKKYLDSIKQRGKVIYSAEDDIVDEIISETTKNIYKIPYTHHPYEVFNNKTFLKILGGRLPIHIFGKHNMHNIAGAIKICQSLHISEEKFYRAVRSFTGTSKHLQLMGKSKSVNIYLDYAYSPTKLNATIKAIREQYENRELVVCLELNSIHNFNASFLKQYNGSMNLADEKIIYFNPTILQEKDGVSISKEDIKQAFGSTLIKVYSDIDDIKSELYMIQWYNKNLLLMSSSDTPGITELNFQELAKKISSLSV
ncbi:MAG: Mur ligase domain-containing protein [Bacteroidales bacterium]